MPELISGGFGLVESEFSDRRQAQLLSSLARLLQFDQRWQNPDSINELFAKAQALAPTDTDIAYWYGERLINNEINKQQGLKLNLHAVESD